MATIFPKTLFVKREKDTENDYFVADDGLIGMVDVGERLQIAVYKLSHVDTVEGLVQVVPPSARKR